METYTIIFSQKDTENELHYWIDSNEFKTKEEAEKHATQMCRKWKKEGETIYKKVLKHVGHWKVKYD